MPTIAALLIAYRDRTGESYEEMARKVGDEITKARMHQLATRPPRGFPAHTQTLELLARLLGIDVTTVVLAFAAGMGLNVRSDGPELARLLPPGVDDLDQRARDHIVRTAVELLRVRDEARQAATNTPADPVDPPPITSPEPATQYHYGLAARRGPSEGRRLRDDQDTDAES